MKLNGLPTLVSKIWTPPEIKRQTKVALCVCSHRKVDISIISQCMPLFANKQFDYSWIPMIGEADISQGRSRAASYFYEKTDDDIFLFADDDIIFKEDDITKLINNVLDGKLICGAMYVQKPTLGKTIVLEEGDSITFSKTAKPQKVVSVPTGMMAISRKVFEKLVEAKKPNGDPLVPLCNKGASWAFYPFFDSQPMKVDGGWRFIPEDWAFCLIARSIGIATWCDPSILVSHVGNYAYDLRDKLLPKKISWDEFDSLTLK